MISKKANSTFLFMQTSREMKWKSFASLSIGCIIIYKHKNKQKIQYNFTRIDYLFENLDLIVKFLSQCYKILRKEGKRSSNKECLSIKRDNLKLDDTTFSFSFYYNSTLKILSDLLILIVFVVNIYHSNGLQILNT